MRQRFGFWFFSGFGSLVFQELFAACCSPVFQSVLHIFHTSAHPNEEPHSNNYIGNPRGQQIRKAQAASMQQPVLFPLFIFLLGIFSHKFPVSTGWFLRVQAGKERLTEARVRWCGRRGTGFPPVSYDFPPIWCICCLTV